MARKKNRVIPIQPSKVLLDYQKIYNNDVIHILRFVPGSNGKDEQFALKCNCGKASYLDSGTYKVIGYVDTDYGFMVVAKVSAYPRFAGWMA